MTGGSRALRTAALVSVVASFALALATGALALGVTQGGGFHCASYPSCILHQQGATVEAHVVGGELLGVAILLSFLFAVALRRQYPGSWKWAGASLVVVVIMGGIGGGLSTGALPPLFLFVQVGFLVLLLLLLLWTLQSLLEPVRPPTSSSSPSSEAPPTERSAMNPPAA